MCLGDKSYLIVSVAGNFDTGFPNFHINHQTLNYWQCILVISEVLGKSRLKWNKAFTNGRIWFIVIKAAQAERMWKLEDTINLNNKEMYNENSNVYILALQLDYKFS